MKATNANEVGIRAANASAKTADAPAKRENLAASDELWFALSEDQPPTKPATQPVKVVVAVATAVAATANPPPFVPAPLYTPGNYAPGEVGFAQRFEEQFQALARFDATIGRWMVWTGTHWAHSKKGQVVEYMKAVARSILMIEVPVMQRQSKDLNDYWALKARSLRKDGDRLHHNQAIVASLAMAQTMPRLVAETADFDQDLMLFNCRTGTIDLNNGTVRPHDSADMLTQMTDIELAPEGATCPRWLEFLSQVMQGDQTMVDYLQRICGYMLTGSTEEHAFFMLFGGGGGGKSVFLNVLCHLMGKSAHVADFTSFLEMNRTGPRTDLAAMQGMRLVVANEAPLHCKLDSRVMKCLTGGDSIPVRRLYQEEFSFKSKATLMFATNIKPIITEKMNAIWDRMHLIPFDGSFRKSKAQDKKLESKLIAESSAILRWALEGCNAWREQGLNMPKRVADAVDEYRCTMDDFQVFIDEKCEVLPGAMESSQALYLAYTQWCAATGQRFPMKQMAFNQELERKTFVRKKTRTMNAWAGLKLRRFGGMDLCFTDAMIEPVITPNFGEDESTDYGTMPMMPAQANSASMAAGV